MVEWNPACGSGGEGQITAENTGFTGHVSIVFEDLSDKTRGKKGYFAFYQFPQAASLGPYIGTVMLAGTMYDQQSCIASKDTEGLPTTQSI